MLYTIHRPEFVKIAEDDIAIGEGTIILPIDSYNDVAYTPSIVIGNHVSIGRYCMISCIKSVIIHDSVTIGDNVHITDNDHEYNDLTISIMKQGVKINEVEIGEFSWIGRGAAILRGVHIGKNCVVGANSVVTKDIPDRTVVAGVPAKPIKRYNEDTKEWEKI